MGADRLPSCRLRYSTMTLWTWATTTSPSSTLPLGPICPLPPAVRLHLACGAMSPPFPPHEVADPRSWRDRAQQFHGELPLEELHLVATRLPDRLPGPGVAVASASEPDRHRGRRVGGGGARGAAGGILWQRCGGGGGHGDGAEEGVEPEGQLLEGLPDRGETMGCTLCMHGGGSLLTRVWLARDPWAWGSR